jgi:CIC family chloride channel protein
MIATSVSLGIGGSGGVFAPSLFLGVMTGTAYGVIVDHVFGAVAGPPALYAAVAMGAVFTSAARAPLTSLASVVEMTGDFTLTLPVMLAVAIATTISRGVSYGTIYTTKLLRRGTDLDRSTPWRALQDVKLADAMRPLPAPLNLATDGHRPSSPEQVAAALPGPVTDERTPQALYASESLSQALRQLMLYGRDGLPVLSADGARVEGWVTNASAIHAIAHDLGPVSIGGTSATLQRDLTAAHQSTDAEEAPNPLSGYRVLEVLIDEHSTAAGKPLSSVDWPGGHTPVSVMRHRDLREADPRLVLAVGDRVNLLARRTALHARHPEAAAVENTDEA